MELKKLWINGKKGNAAFRDLGSLAISIATIAIILTVAFLIMSQGKQQIQEIEGLNANGTSAAGTQSSQAWNATSTLQDATGDIPGWIPIIVITSIGMILLTLALSFQKMRMR